MTSLDIVIVNWNTGLQLRDCLESILHCNRTEYKLDRIVVVDNNSTDQSIEDIHTTSLPLIVIKNSTNRGFAAACNQGAANTKADFILFLNPDTRLFENSLSKPLKFMLEANNSKIGICSIQLVDSSNKVSCTCAYFPSLAWYFTQALGLHTLRFKPLSKKLPKLYMTERHADQSGVVDQVIGAFFLVRREVFEILDGFDERFFVYFEEVDFSLRALHEGFFSYFLADVQAFHKGGGSSDQVKPSRLLYSLHSRVKYGYKHFKWLKGTVLLILTLLVEPFSRIFLAIFNLSWIEVRDILLGYLMLIQKLFIDSFGSRKI